MRVYFNVYVYGDVVICAILCIHLCIYVFMYVFTQLYFYWLLVLLVSVDYVLLFPVNLLCKFCNKTTWTWSSQNVTVCLLMLKILCSGAKLTFVLMLSAWNVSMCLTVLYLCITLINTGFVCLIWVYVVIEDMVNSKWFQISKSWTQNVLNTR